MMRKLVSAVVTLWTLGLAPTSFAANNSTVNTTKGQLCQGVGGSVAGGNIDHPACGANIDTHLTNHVSSITNALLVVAGAIAVIIIIISGIRYVMSQGDSAAVKQAKDTLLYAIIGLIVVILAYAIVNFVYKQLT